MTSYTENLNLLKKDPVADGDDTFNIDTMLNDNWNKIDEKCARESWYGTCPTSYSTSAKVVTTSTKDFKLKAGHRVTVKFTYYNSAGSPSLNVDGTGAKYIKAYGTTAPSSYSWTSGEVVDFIYDGTYFIMVDGGIADTSRYGVTKLSSSINSTSTSLAATASAVKSAYDRANVAYNLADNITARRTCRFVVGTSTAGWTQDDCDYLCDGTDDHVEIQAAINALLDTGGEIIVLDGIYSIAGTINIPSSGASMNEVSFDRSITLAGSGRKDSTVFKKAHPQPGNASLISIGRDCTIIKNFTFDGNSDDYSIGRAMNLLFANSCVIENNVFINNAYAAVMTYWTRHTIIQDNVFINNTGYYNIEVSSETNECCICNNVFVRTYDDCPNSIPIHTVASVMKNCVISGNIIKNFNYGINICGQCTNIENNQLIDISAKGISFEGGVSSDQSYQNSFGCSVVGNTIIFSSDRGAITNGGGICIDYESTLINVTGNFIMNAYNGIYLGDDTKSNTVVGNVCKDNERGIILLYRTSNNNIIGNTVLCGGGLPSDYTSNQRTISLVDSNDNNIAYNYIMGKNYEIFSGTGNSFVGNKYQ